MSTLTMVRTQCCEAYKGCGRKCEICPNRPENRQAVLQYKLDALPGLGCDRACHRSLGAERGQAVAGAIDY